MFVECREGLQTRAVGGEAELTIANRKRRAGIECAEHGIVPGDNGAAIEGRALCGEGGRDGTQGGAAGDGHRFQL
jgi:hypothetical protein